MTNDESPSSPFSANTQTAEATLPDKHGTEPAKERCIPTVSATFDDGRILEMVHRPSEKRSAFVIWKNCEWKTESSFSRDARTRLVPYSPNNNLIRNDVVLFPSEPEEYGSEEQLLGEIQAFVHRYVDLSPLFEKTASYYVLLSWVYDGFNELPYLRVRGDPGSGKTRFLLTVGSLCYKPIFASGASTVSPLFRMLDAFRGTLIIDESDFRQSDERAEVVKIFNNGNGRGFPVLRSEVSAKGEFNPHAYWVYGPKIIATRGPFEDRALESRCLTEEMGQQGLRGDVPINLSESYKEEALHLRNKLLLFRFRNLGRRTPTEELVDRMIEPRLNQIFVPLLSIIEDPAAREDLRELARRYNHEMIAERGMDMEAQVLEIIQDLASSSYGNKLTIRDITSSFVERHGADYERKITTKWIGYIVRRKLHLATHKSHGVFVIPMSELPKLDRLYEKYGVSSETDEGENVQEAARLELGVRVDFGDVGDFI
ncbi:MAG: hypothetical protein HYR72_27095 [Deltaproteobacteria bacterium]|nr:hypothetical protein [Deltaproteobacteria bacterium]MBI3390318.1 hypothetical protein [Deltaproteobacteria bacterium]